MRKKLLTIAAILTLAAVSTTILIMTVLAGSGNPGGDESLHPDYSSDHESNEIVGVPCATGSHTTHVVPNVGLRTVTEHIHHATWYWYDSDEDDPSLQGERVVKLACGDVPHVDNSIEITSWGNYGTVGWDDDDDKFTFTGDDDTGFGRYTKLRLDYCNGLIDDGNAGAYSPFEGVPDLCDRYFFDAREQRPFPSGGV